MSTVGNEFVDVQSKIPYFGRPFNTKSRRAGSVLDLLVEAHWTAYVFSSRTHCCALRTQEAGTSLQPTLPPSIFPILRTPLPFLLQYWKLFFLRINLTRSEERRVG